MNISLLGIVIKFAEYNLVFDGLIVFFTVVYFFAGIKRGMKRTLWYVIFDIISITAAIILANIVCPLFIDRVPTPLPGSLTPGLKFFILGISKLLMKILTGFLIFLIIRFGIFKKILTVFADRDYNLGRKKKGRLISGILTAGLAFVLSSGVIVGTHTISGELILKNYFGELNETYVAKHADSFIRKATDILVETKSVENPDNFIVRTLTNDEYTLEDFPNYKDSVSRLSLTSNPEEYLNEINASTDEGLIIFNQDLHFWMVITEQGGHYAMLDSVVAPVAEKAVELGYHYNGLEEALYDIKPNQAYFSSSTYNNLVSIYYE